MKEGVEGRWRGLPIDDQLRFEGGRGSKERGRGIWEGGLKEQAGGQGATSSS